jgi:transposase
MKQELNERQWRHYLATEALRIGSRGIRRVMRDSGADFETIKRGIREVRAGESYTPGDRVRSPGGGRKKLSESDESLLADLEALLEPKGDPRSLLRWTTKSLSHLERALAQMGDTIKESALANLLHELGFSLKANKKNIEGISHPDRDEQFRHIDERCKAFEKLGEPIISVDCKKKELLGDFKNGGREWQAKGKNTTVNVYDYRSLSSGKAVPYGGVRPRPQQGSRQRRHRPRYCRIRRGEHPAVVGNHRQRDLPGGSEPADHRRWRGQ